MEASDTSQTSQAGNTKTAYQNQLYCWTFTIKYVDITIEDLASQLQEISKKWVFQVEKGELGFLHYQGVMSLKTKEYFNTVKNLMPNSTHLEQCRDWWASWRYCQKPETRINGPFFFNVPMIKVIKTLLPWQEKCLTICQSEPDDRTLYWYYDQEGGKGKTAFCKYMGVTHGAQILANGRAGDIGHALMDNPKIVLFNLTRTTEERFNYQALEAIKDGMFFKSKYESKTVFFNSPHVMVFANFLPNLRSVTESRWKIIDMCHKYEPGEDPADYQ